MADKQECPICRHNANEGTLRVNIQVEDIVTAWKTARPYMLKLAKDDADAQAEASTAGKKRKRGPEPSTSRSNSNTTAAGNAEVKRETPEEDDDIEMIGSLGAKAQPGDDDPIDCPVCFKPVKFKNVNSHIDSNCKRLLHTPKPTKASTSTSSSSNAFSKLMPSGKSRGKHKEDDNAAPLPKVSYDTLKDKKIRELLADEKLPTTGDRATCVERHKKWVMIYNGNLDRSASNRKSRAQLQKELKNWEETIKPKSSKKPAVENAEAYVRNHNDDFRRLVEQARASRPKKDRDSAQDSQVDAVQDARQDEFTPSSTEPTPPMSSSPNKDMTIIDLNSSQDSAEVVA
ncbi:uncharacterized protein SCHCODRAFT_02482875 [Schizophyllum commune H4-8]|nr:uncharacterized protein SCHCODRAFT_02482875 [Schizophyllum commune H4-8]KAI5899301.1 hypothetical protein SCHCODRAFT_02482875 [Schizophyllum commune H4-8]